LVQQLERSLHTQLWQWQPPQVGVAWGVHMAWQVPQSLGQVLQVSGPLHFLSPQV